MSNIYRDMPELVYCAYSEDHLRTEEWKKWSQNRYHKYYVDAWLTLGVCPSEMTEDQRRLLFYVRLFKLVQSGQFTLEEARDKIAEFNNALDLGYPHPNLLALSLYGWNVKTGILRIGRN